MVSQQLFRPPRPSAACDCHIKSYLQLQNGTVFHAALGRGNAPLCASPDLLIASVFAMTWRYLQGRLTCRLVNVTLLGSVRVDVPAVHHVKGATEVVVLRGWYILQVNNWHVYPDPNHHVKRYPGHHEHGREMLEFPRLTRDF